MKKIIINTIIISLLSISAIFADNNNISSSNKQSAISNQQSVGSIAVVTINDMNGKLVYTETFTVDTKNVSNIKLNPDQKLTKGMYIVTVVVDGQKMNHKLIVQ